jgi:hypothetical protein
VGDRPGRCRPREIHRGVRGLPEFRRQPRPQCPAVPEPAPRRVSSCGSSPRAL